MSPFGGSSSRRKKKIIAIITETFIWDLPEEEKEFTEYSIQNLTCQVNKHENKAITVNQYTHICEKEEEQ